MGGHRIINQQSLHFLTFTVVGWVDVFTRQSYKEILIESLKFCIKEKGLILNSFVIMSNHLHLIARTDSDKGLSSIIRDFKKFTARKIITEIQQNNSESRREWMLRLFQYYAKYNKNNDTYQFWKQDSRPIELVSIKWIQQKLDYIHHNPVVAGIVDVPEYYIYSSARNYLGQNGVLDVEVLDVQTHLGFQ